MTASYRELERLTIVSPLGVRFWDGVLNVPVFGGLSVGAFPAGNPDRRTEAVVNRSAVYVFQHLPGLHDFEYPAGDADPRAGPSGTRPFVVDVEDVERRFLPFQFQVSLPVRGLLTWQCPAASPLGPPVPAVPVFSAPTRPVPAAMGAIRLELWEAAPRRPAAGALVEVGVQGAMPAQGIADDRGRVLLVFPYPEPRDGSLLSPPASPPASSPGSLAEQSWTVALSAFYAPQPAPPYRPDLCATLTQPPATLWQDAALSRPATTGTVRFGRDALYGWNGASLSTLFIEPIGSPP